MIRYYVILDGPYRTKLVWWIPACIAKALRERT